MRLDTFHSLILILVVAAVTFLTRALPFLIFGRGKTVPPLIEYLGQVLPYAVMGLLVVYCLRNIQLTKTPFGGAEIIAVAAVVILHKWRHNMLLSIGAGTMLYMILVQFIFIV